MQKWYRVWKEHYLQKCQEIDREFKVEAKFKPFWLIPNLKNPIVNADKSLYYFTNIVNALVVFKLCYDLYSLSTYDFLKFILPTKINRVLWSPIHTYQKVLYFKHFDENIRLTFFI